MEHSVTSFVSRYLLDGTDVTILPKEFKQEKPKNDWIKGK